MATASELETIKSNPISEGLRTFRRCFESTRADLGLAAPYNDVQAVFSLATVAGMARLLFR